MSVLTYNQIKKQVGETWALIYNPVYSEKNKLIKGELIMFDSDKMKIEQYLIKDKNPKKIFTVLWFGKVPDEKILLNFF